MHISAFLWRQELSLFRIWHSRISSNTSNASLGCKTCPGRASPGVHLPFRRQISLMQGDAASHQKLGHHGRGAQEQASQSSQGLPPQGLDEPLHGSQELTGGGEAPAATRSARAAARKGRPAPASSTPDCATPGDGDIHRVCTEEAPKRRRSYGPGEKQTAAQTLHNNLRLGCLKMHDGTVKAIEGCPFCGIINHWLMSPMSRFLQSDLKALPPPN